MKNFIFIIALYLHVGLPLNAAVKGKEGRILVRMPYPGGEDVEDAKDDKIGGFLSLIAVQAGSTVEIDTLKIVDLSSGRIIYQNNFDAGNLKGLHLQHSHDPKHNRIVNGRLRLKAAGHYEAYGRMHMEDELPKNFELSFVVNKTRWTGHFAFAIFSDPSQRYVPIAKSGVRFETNINGGKINHVTLWDSPPTPKPNGWKSTPKALYGVHHGNSGPYMGRDVHYKLRVNKGKVALWVDGKLFATN